MSKIIRSGATAVALIIGCHGAHAQTPIPPSPQDFIMAAAQSDQYEILAAHLAEVQGQEPQVRAFAAEMIQDHTRLTADLRRAAQASGLPAPGSGMSSDEAALLSGLQGLRGAAFDKAYARQQVLAHTQAAAVEESFAEAGADLGLKTAAQAALPTIKALLTKASQLRDALGGS